MTDLSKRAATVAFRNVSKIYGDSFKAIESLDLTIQAGEFLTLLGPSGSGKTTALNLLAGFQNATEGSILIDGQDIGVLPPHKRNIGVVFQHYALFPHMTVAQNIAYPLRQRRVPTAEIARRVADALRLVSLENFANRLPRHLSGGQQQRVAVARAVVFQPRLLLMDEPLGALDRKLRESVQLEIKRIHRELGVTIVFVTHDQEEALVMSDRIAIFDAGRIQQIGTAQDIYDRPASQFVAQFLGDSNCFVGEITPNGNELQLTTADATLIGAKGSASPDQGRGALVVRPERCSVFKPGDVPAGWNAVNAHLRDIIYLGATRKLVAATQSGVPVCAIIQSGRDIPSGSQLAIAFPPDAGQVVATRK